MKKPCGLIGTSIQSEALVRETRGETKSEILVRMKNQTAEGVNCKIVFGLGN